ncbi:MAG: hypothetical protein KC587_18075 [Nitrospira sp.]|nr:hypothetical protein [Nitrospira sp.]
MRRSKGFGDSRAAHGKDEGDEKNEGQSPLAGKSRDPLHNVGRVRFLDY